MRPDRLYYEETSNRFVLSTTNPNTGKIWGVARARKGDGYVWVMPGRYPDALNCIHDFKSYLPEGKATKRAAEHIAYLREVPTKMQELAFIKKSGYEFKRTPYMHQMECIEALLHYHKLAVIAEQGLGKTYISLCYIEILKRLLNRPLKALILGPRIVLKNWQMETDQYTNLSYLLYRGDVDTRRRMRARVAVDGFPEVVITNYEMATPIEAHNREFEPLRKRDIQAGDQITVAGEPDAWLTVQSCHTGEKANTQVFEVPGRKIAQKEVKKARRRMNDPWNYMEDYDFLKSMKPDIIILDEGSRLKGSNSKRSLAIQTLAERAERVVLLSGTISLGNPLDVYQPFNLLNPLIFQMNYFQFKNKYCETSKYNKHVITGYKNLDDLKARIDPYMLSKKKAECVDLPDRIMSLRYYDLSESQIELYNAIVHSEDSVEVGGAIIDVSSTILKINKLMQVLGGFMILPLTRTDEVCNHCEYLNGCIEGSTYPWDRACHLQGTGKVEHIKRPKRTYYQIPGPNPKLELLKGVLESPETGKLIIWAYYEKELSDIEQLLQSMKISYITANEEDCDYKYESSDELRVFLGQVSQGIGITLNSGTTMLYYSQSLSLEHRLQSLERNYRIGQTEKVLTYDFVNPYTIEATVLELLNKKEDVKDFIQRREVCIDCSQQQYCLDRGLHPYTETCVYFVDRMNAEAKVTLKLKPIPEGASL